jgi:cytochrome oxidase Cu insertion factor (SCO1/SenC/PrrC family)
MDKNKLLNLIIIAGSLAIVLILAAAGYQAATQAMEGSDKGPAPLATLTPPTPGEPTVSATLAPGDAETSPSTTQTNAQDSPARLAPDFTVYDLEGNAHKLSDFRGKPVVLNF